PRRFLTPNEALFASLTRGSPLRIPADPNLTRRFLPHRAVKPQDDGVPIDGITYWCPKYPDLVAAASEHGKRRSRLVFHFDPYDRSQVFWNEPNTYNWRTLWAPGGDQKAIA